MTAGTVDQLVTAYLSRLQQAATSLPAGRREELLTEIREHIDAARVSGAADPAAPDGAPGAPEDEAAIRTMLDRLGEPEEIVAAAQDSLAGTDNPPMVAARRGTGLELTAVLLLTVGSFVPLIGWGVGAILLWASHRWTIGEKLLGTLVVPGGPALVFWLTVLVPAQVCSSSTESTEGGAVVSVDESCTGFALPVWLGLPVFVGILVAPFVVAGVLYSRARARAAEEPQLMRPARGPARPVRSPWGAAEITAVVLLGACPLIAFLLGPIGLLAGLLAVIVALALVWNSPQWSQREKKVATLITAVPVGIALVLAVLAATVWRIT